MKDPNIILEIDRPGMLPFRIRRGNTRFEEGDTGIRTPCPFCGNKNIGIEMLTLKEDVTEIVYWRAYRAFCFEGCNAATSTFKTKEEAAQAWKEGKVYERD